MRNARVFISCGQRTDREIKIGKAVQDYFLGRDFEAYFAEKVHSSDALTENIFKFLRQSEYFVFIDFKREEIKEGEFRGSLFVNQELAIATFLRLQGLGFCEKGVKREGILHYHIYNAFPFKDETEIIQKLEEETKNWDINSVNELKMRYNPESTSKNFVLTDLAGQPLSDWYHLEIKNRNKSRDAFSCLGYVTMIKNLDINEEYEIPSIELIWSGIGQIVVDIMGGTSRELDAFCIIHGEDEIRFHQRKMSTNNQRYFLPNLPKGKYLIEYSIISSDFEKVSQSYILDFGGSKDEITFREAD